MNIPRVPGNKELNRFFASLWVICVLGVLCISCSPYATGPVPNAYHNLTSHYNAYFLARERMKELELNLLKSHKDDYNKLLEIYPLNDENFAKANKDKLDKIIKNASLPIQWHKPSHWVNDCYLIIGKCRFYDYDTSNSFITFRFIPVKYEEEYISHLSKIWLMRTHMWQREWDQARDIANELENEYLHPKNVGLFSLANAHWYIKNKQYPEAYDRLKVGIRYIKPRFYRARMYYLLGQLAQKKQDHKSAYTHYKKAARMNVTYELTFYSKLNMYQLKEIESDKQAEKILKHYAKLLKDLKNRDLKDKIYYEMGMFELKRNHEAEAIKHFKNSAKYATTNIFVKSVAYLRLAEIYYDRQQDYEKAKLYYDSTMTLLDKEMSEYPTSAKRQRILEDFVKQLKIVRREDSLQALSRMSKEDLDKFIDEKIAKDEADLQKQVAEKKKKALKLAREGEDTENNVFSNPNTPLLSTFSDPDAKWYFYNPPTLENGKIEFARKWGARANEDNWRRASKERTFTESGAENTGKVGQLTDKSKAVEDSANVLASSIVNKLDENRKLYYRDIPTPGPTLDSSNARLKRALFRLARIYDQYLEEYLNAGKTFDRYIEQFLDDERRPEALYSNYLIFKNKMPDEPRAERYKQMILDEHPYSLYSKLLKNPNYLQENKLLGDAVKALYREAFEHYKNGDYLKAQNSCELVLQNYPDSDYEDRVQLLKVMIIGQTQSMAKYIEALEIYITAYKPKKSKMVPYAKDLLEKAKNLAKSDTSALTKRVAFELDLNHKHTFCMIVSPKILPQLKENYKKYLQEYYEDQALLIDAVEFKDTLSLVYISGLPNKIQAMNFFERQKSISSPLRGLENQVQTFFVASEPNFNIIRQEKIYQPYLEFFRKNYGAKF